MSTWAWILLFITAALNVLASCFVVRAARLNRKTTDLLGQMIGRRDGTAR